MTADLVDLAPLMGPLAADALEVEAFLAAALPEGRGVARLNAAMRYALFAGGKRLRPFLVFESARLVGAAPQGARVFAAAIEAIHTYSLVHDDLPAMDNDDLRRGKPTLHRAFDEATAILAGDGLLTLAFDMLAQAEGLLSPRQRVALIALLAKASGAAGMVGGQMLDLAAEGRFEAVRTKPDEAAVLHIQALKTGALIEAAVMSAPLMRPDREEGDARAVLADHNASTVTHITTENAALALYGRHLGLAFQIRDDLLDVEGDAAALGKNTGKDARSGKATFVDLYGVQGASAQLEQLTKTAEQAVAAAFGARAQRLILLLTYNRLRKS